nr:hypothetical protein [Candidatus Eremiobacteraeota bacterium]
GAQLTGGPTEPPDIDDDEESPHDGVLVGPDQEVRESQLTAPEPIASDPLASESFEPLEFVPAVFDPVVGLDLAPSGAPHELEGASTGSEGGTIDDRSDAVRSDEAEALDYVTAGPFATETMAGLLAAQGHTEQAIALYERLTAERPADTALRARLAALRGEQTVEDAPTAVDATLDSSATDAARAALLTAAFADVSAQPRGAEDAGVTSDRLVTPDRDPDPFADVSFDRFFPASGSPPAGAEPADTPAPSADDADLTRFDAWLHDLAA